MIQTLAREEAALTNDLTRAYMQSDYRFSLDCPPIRTYIDATIPQGHLDTTIGLLRMDAVYYPGRIEIPVMENLRIVINDGSMQAFYRTIPVGDQIQCVTSIVETVGKYHETLTNYFEDGENCKEINEKYRSALHESMGSIGQVVQELSDVTSRVERLRGRITLMQYYSTDRIPLQLAAVCRYLNRWSYVCSTIIIDNVSISYDPVSNNYNVHHHAVLQEVTDSPMKAAEIANEIDSRVQCGEMNCEEIDRRLIKSTADHWAWVNSVVL